MSSFVLGLSNGTACLAFCAPAIMPYLLYKGEGTIKNYYYLLLFFLGRMVGYLIFGVLAFLLGNWILTEYTHKPALMGMAYILISTVFIYELIKGKKRCPKKNRLIQGKNRTYSAFLIGFATGINLCPSFLLILTTAVAASSIWGSLSVFLFFYLGTMIYFLPLPLIGLIKNHECFRTISKFLIAFISIHYLYKGFIMIFNSGRLY